MPPAMPAAHGKCHTALMLTPPGVAPGAIKEPSLGALGSGPPVAAAPASGSGELAWTMSAIRWSWASRPSGRRTVSETSRRAPRKARSHQPSAASQD
eukprot:scaffold329751_cov63-Tisochrysis_lutea.AAC.3